jgi:hypothetical protein
VTETGESAHRVAYKRGHLTLEQRGNIVVTFECKRCKKTGVVGPDGKPMGRLFREDCGTPTGVSYTYGARTC